MSFADLGDCFSRKPQNREQFAAQMLEKFGILVVPLAFARQAVADADLFLCAADNLDPVIDSAWLKQEAHVNIIGPKSAGERELPFDIGDRWAVIATDSSDRCRLSGIFLLQDAPTGDQMIGLADILARRDAARHTNADLTLFCSVGLAGTEVAVASTILRRGSAVPTPRDRMSLSLHFGQVAKFDGSDGQGGVVWVHVL
jgi:ornithine cyclodeaminase